jgi:hypothetical protein
VLRKPREALVRLGKSTPNAKVVVTAKSAAPAGAVQLQTGAGDHQDGARNDEHDADGGRAWHLQADSVVCCGSPARKQRRQRDAEERRVGGHARQG